LLVYPDPAGDLVTVCIPGFRNGSYYLEISSISGARLDKININAERSSLSFRQYSRGMYILKLYRDEKLLGLKKIIRN
jgi:hypothetical protein